MMRQTTGLYTVSRASLFSSRTLIGISVPLICVLFLCGLFGGTEAWAREPDVQLGVFLPEPGDLDSFENQIGRETNIFLWYQAIAESFDEANLGPHSIIGTQYPAGMGTA